MKTKKQIAWILIMMLLVTYFPSTAFGSEFGEVGRGRVKMSLDFLNVDNLKAGPTDSASSVPQLNAGDIVWVGLRVSDMTKANWPVLADYGIQQLKMTFNYDTRYIVPYTEYSYKSEADLGDPDSNFQESILKYSGWDAKYAWNSAGTTYQQEINLDSAEPSYVDAQHSKAFALHIEIPDRLPVTKQRFYNSDDASSSYIFKIPMKIVSLPPEGTKILENSLSGNNTAAVFAKQGEMNDEWSGEWDANSEDLSINRNLKNYIVFKGNVDLFPSKVSVTYHDNASVDKPVTANSAEGVKQKVAQGNSLKDENLTIQQGPTRPGYIFKGWFEGAGATGAEFTNETKLNADKEVYAKWAEGYAITFNANGGELNKGTAGVYTVEKEKGHLLEAGDVPTATREGYKYDKWNTKANGTGTDISKDQVAGHNFNNTSATLYPVWVPDGSKQTAKVEFDRNVKGENIKINPESITLNVGDNIGLGMPDEPTRENYTFTGWNTKRNGTGDKFDKDTKVQGNIKVYAQWKPNSAVLDPKDVKVTFESTDATKPANPGEVSIKAGSSVGYAMPDEPERTGYAFGGWKDKTTQADFDADTIVNEDKTVVPKWVEDATVTFNENGGTKGAGYTDSVKVSVGKKIPADKFPTAANLTRDGYTLKGWNTKANGTGENYDENTVINGNTTLYAKWEADAATAVTVKFDGNRATKEANPKEVSVKKGDSLGTMMPDNPERTNYKFKEWNTKKNGTGEVFTKDTVVNEGKTVYAQWEADPAIVSPKNVTVTFDSDGADTPANPASITIKAGDNIGEGNMPNNPVKNGFVFDKWLSTGDNSEFTGNTPVNDNIMVKATWKTNPQITFNANGGKIDGQDTKAVDVTYNTPLSAAAVPTAQRADYEFVKWNTKANGTGDDLDTVSNRTENATYYAIWKATKDPVTVTFNGNGAGKEANPATITVNKGDKIGLGMPEAPERDKYKFDKWNTKQNGSGTEFTGETPVQDNMTVYAQWKVDIAGGQEEVTVTFEAADATVQPNPTTKKVVKGDSIGDANMPEAPKKDGYVFEKWQDAIGVDFTGSTKVNDNMTVTAVWKQNIEVKFNGNGGQFAGGTGTKTVEVPAGTKIGNKLIAGSEVTRANYEFKEWNTKPNGTGTVFDAESQVDNAVEVYAIWTAAGADQVTVTFDNNAIDPTKLTKEANPKTVTINKGDALGTAIATPPEMTDYEFKGWNTKPNGLGKDISADTNIDKTMTVYAKWEAKGGANEANNISVIFYMNKKNEANDTSDEYVEAKQIIRAADLPKFEDKFLPFTDDDGAVAENKGREGYKFVQWNTSDGNKFNKDTAQPGADKKLKLFATWETEATFVLGQTVFEYDNTFKTVPVTEVKGYDIHTITLVQGTDYEFVFKKQGASDTTDKIKDAGVYDIEDIKALKTHANADKLILDKVPPVGSITINPKGVTLTIDSDQNPKTDGNTAVTMTGTVEPNETNVTFKYYKAVAGAGNTITKGEEVAEPKEYGKYIVEANTTDPNYVVSAVKHVSGTLAIYDNSVYADGTTGKNIKLEIQSAAKLTGITVTNTEDKKLDMYKKAADKLSDTDKTEYKDDVTDYYVSVKDGEKVKVKFEGTLPDANFSVTKNGTPVELEGNETSKTTKELTLDPLDPNTQTTPDAKFGNTYVINVGGKEYKIHVRQLLKPEIKLNYGNSPYGEIMRDNAIVDKEAAKQYFRTNLKFANNMLPSGMSTKVKYTERAWGDANKMTELEVGSDVEKWKLEHPGQKYFINYDKDMHALFGIMGTKVKDPGFKIKDSLGKEVALSAHNSVKRSMTLDKMSKLGVVGFSEGVTQEKLENVMVGAADENDIDLTKFRARPGIYEIKYEYVDDAGVTISEVRMFMVKAKLGDVDMNGYINPVDATAINKDGSSPLPSENTVGLEKQGRFFRYRVIDVDKNLYVNPVDATAVNKSSSVPLIPFYVSIP